MRVDLQRVEVGGRTGRSSSDVLIDAKCWKSCLLRYDAIDSDGDPKSVCSRIVTKDRNVRLG